MQSVVEDTTCWEVNQHFARFLLPCYTTISSIHNHRILVFIASQRGKTEYLWSKCGGFDNNWVCLHGSDSARTRTTAISTSLRAAARIACACVLHRARSESLYTLFIPRAKPRGEGPQRDRKLGPSAALCSLLQTLSDRVGPGPGSGRLQLKIMSPPSVKYFPQ